MLGIDRVINTEIFLPIIKAGIYRKINIIYIYNLYFVHNIISTINPCSAEYLKRFCTTELNI